MATATSPCLARALGSGEPLGFAELLDAPLRTSPRPSRLTRPLTDLPGAGPKLAAAAAELEISTLGELLRHVPREHRAAEAVSAVSELRTGADATIDVEVTSARKRPTRRRGLVIVEAAVRDATGSVKAIWFNQAWLAEKLRPGTRLLLSGKVDRRGFRVATHEIVGRRAGEGEGGDSIAQPPRGTAPAEGSLPAGIHTTGLIPVHPASERLKAQRIREWAWRVLALAGDAADPLDSSLRASRGYPGAEDALRAIHFPRGLDEADLARRRLAFEELYTHQVALALRRTGHDRTREAIAFDPPGELTADWLAALPFEPTADQRSACAEIDDDLARGVPMQRLLMGEVGSGKTVVALYAMLRALEAGQQAALMAPTETLAEQHFRTLERLLAAAPVPATLLTGSAGAARRREALERLASGELGLVVGTHALITDEVSFARLALVVIDEQHRFGVRQRAALDAKGPGGMAPHALHMTATPIPRTLSLTAYGDLDTTVLRELPAGRKPVRTWVVGEEKRAGAYGYLRDQLRAGRQAYVVCPLVESSDAMQARAATEEARRLASGELREFSVGALHGQMPSAERASVMERFASGELDVLVATTVIEVGVDVPNATVMVIESADRYGLSQLHQLRGRVGRGEHASACILFADPESERARARLEAIASESDGFRLAEVDLALRGEGEVLGTRQHGLPRFRVAELPEDAELLSDARAAVIATVREGPLDRPEHELLVAEARARFGDERDERLAA